MEKTPIQSKGIATIFLLTKGRRTEVSKSKYMLLTQKNWLNYNVIIKGADIYERFFKLSN